MDVYLPADFYRLRDDLPDWRDVSSACAGTEKSSEQRGVPVTDKANACADPQWRVF
jgi:hypothetical protein